MQSTHVRVCAGNDRARESFFTIRHAMPGIGRCVAAGVLVVYHPCQHPTLLVWVLPTYLPVEQLRQRV